jgi:cytokinesis protein
LEPEEIAFKIQQFDQELCTQVFLSELKPVLPSPEQVGKLNVYRNADAVELAGLHPSDRLMVKLIQIDRLGPRIEGMLYRVSFEETWSLLDEGAAKLFEAGNSLLAASSFKELLNLILLIGNYMNGTGIKGGAFGFRISSINKLVDTKSVNNTTLLHFLEKTVSKHFPEMGSFLDELEKPAEAYRINLQDLRKGLGELRDGLKSIRKELEEHFSDPLEDDRYGKQMWQFIAKANRQVEDLVDDVNNAEAMFVEAVSYYGEEDKGMSSSEFYGIFKTFVTSYRVCLLLWPPQSSVLTAFGLEMPNGEPTRLGRTPSNRAAEASSRRGQSKPGESCRGHGGRRRPPRRPPQEAPQWRCHYPTAR